MKKSPIPLVMKTQVMRALYGLPLDIKIRIFQMAINEHMDEWKLEHLSQFASPLYDIIWMGRCHINFSSSINEMNQWNYFDDVFTSKKIKLCDYVNILNDHSDVLIREKVTIYEIENNVYDEIYIRGILDKPNQYWAANKCRCFKCDLVRLAYRLDNLWMKSLCPTINKKYARINYTTGNKQWKTMTVSQMKREKDKLRREYRNRMNLAKKLSFL